MMQRRHEASCPVCNRNWYCNFRFVFVDERGASMLLVAVGRSTLHQALARRGIPADLSRILAAGDTSNSPKRLWRVSAVAAFCECCGALITLKAEACPACGAPQHGMFLSDVPLPAEADAELDQEDGPQLRMP
jgi:hypothetical protein